MHYWIVDGKQITDAEYEELQRQKSEAREQVQREAAALMEKLGQTYEALTSLLQQNPEVGRQVTDRTAADEEIYRKLRRSLERADEAPRCRWVKQDGTGCGSPQIRKHIYCFAHKQMMEARALALRLPAPEDANAIQISLMRVQKALIDDTISAKKAGLLLYSLQLALTNVGQTTFGEADEGELVTEVVDEEEALSSQHSAVSLKQNLFTAKDAEGSRGLQQEPFTAEDAENAKGSRGLQQEPFTAKDAEDAKESRGLPLIRTDDTDKKGLPRMNADGRSGDLVIARDRVIATPKTLPRVNTDSTEPKTGEQGLPRINADERGLEEEEGAKVVTMRM